MRPMYSPQFYSHNTNYHHTDKKEQKFDWQINCGHHQYGIEEIKDQNKRVTKIKLYRHADCKFEFVQEFCASQFHGVFFANIRAEDYHGNSTIELVADIYNSNCYLCGTVVLTNTYKDPCAQQSTLSSFTNCPPPHHPCQQPCQPPAPSFPCPPSHTNPPCHQSPQPCVPPPSPFPCPPSSPPTYTNPPCHQPPQPCIPPMIPFPCPPESPMNFNPPHLEPCLIHSISRSDITNCKLLSVDVQEAQVTSVNEIFVKPLPPITSKEKLCNIIQCCKKTTECLEDFDPHFANKLKQKGHTTYSGPVKANIGWVNINECSITFDGLDVPCMEQGPRQTF